MVHKAASLHMVTCLWKQAAFRLEPHSQPVASETMFHAVIFGRAVTVVLVRTSPASCIARPATEPMTRCNWHVSINPNAPVTPAGSIQK